MNKILEQENLHNILPTKMVKRNIVVLKPSFDQKVLDQFAERLKDKLFTRLKFFKINSSKIKLISTEKWYMQYLIINGKYSIDHCKKLEKNLEVDNLAKKICIFNEEFILDKSDELNPSNSTSFKITGVVHYNYQKSGKFIIDDKSREVELKNWSILLNELLPKENLEKMNLKKDQFEIKISTEQEIDFLRQKLLKRPADVGEVIKEIFEINERKIIFCPIYELHYQNTNKNEAIARINGITGNVVITTFSNKTISGIFFEDLIKPQARNIQSNKIQTKEKIKSKSRNIKKIKQAPTKESILEPISSKNYVERSEKQKNNFDTNIRSEINIEEYRKEPKSKIKGEIFHVGNNVTAIIGDLEIPSETIVEDTLVIKGNFIIGEKCNILGTIKALGIIKIGDNTIIKGDVISNSTVFVGSKVRISGKVISKKTIHSNEKPKR